VVTTIKAFGDQQVTFTLVPIGAKEGLLSFMQPADGYVNHKLVLIHYLDLETMEKLNVDLMMVETVSGESTTANARI
jgi:hypothetical protein